MLMVKGIVGGLFQVALLGLFLLVPAGTWYWPRAIAFLIVYAVMITAAVVFMAKVAPASLEARLAPPMSKSQPANDRIASAILFSALFGWIALVPIDVFHLQLLPKPGPSMSLLGAVVSVIGFAIVMMSIMQNAFAAPIVMDQADRGQTVIDTGLYGLVRHPLYVGLIFFLVGLGLWLESYVSTIAMTGVIAALANRIFVEEKTLANDLPGYTEYMERTPYRLVPRIW